MDKATLEKYRKAGTIARNALQKGLQLIEPGESIAEILDTVENYIRDHGARPAFPAQISINDTAAHHCPHDYDETLEEGNVVKLDVGVSIDGHIADNARTVNLGANKKLKNASEQALDNAINCIKPGVTLGEIGKTIQETITEKGFAPVRNLTGHGLDIYEVHAQPSIPNTDTGNKNKLQENQVIAIEPFASTGAGIVYETNQASVFTLTNPKPVRNRITRNVLETIKTYEGLPFAKRWLIDEFGKGKTRMALTKLKQEDMLEEHPPLKDKQQGKISQAEHTVIVKDEPIITTKIQ